MPALIILQGHLGLLTLHILAVSLDVGLVAYVGLVRWFRRCGFGPVDILLVVLLLNPALIFLVYGAGCLIHPSSMALYILAVSFDAGLVTF